MSDRDWTATRAVGRGAIRGSLELTDTHLRFRPSGVAAKVQGAAFSVQLRHLAAAGTVAATGGVFRRERTRLLLTLGDGSELDFAVRDPDEVATAIRERLGATK